MKPILRCILSCFLLPGLSGFVNAQTAGMNYIHSFEVQIPGITNPASLNLNTPSTTALQNIQYFDGLGRPLQMVQKGITPEGSDLIKPVEYNDAGLDEINYEPYTDYVSSGEYRSNSATAQPAFYSQLFGDANGKSPVVYEKSPLGRILQQGAPGASWQLDAAGHAVRIAYLSNNSSDPKLSSLLWKVSASACTEAGNYADNELYVTRTVGEDGAETYEFRDKQEQVLLKRSVLDDVTMADTYYVYDESGLLRFVISPEGSARISGDFNASDDLVRKYVYCYTYDERKRLVEKQVPGKEPEYYVYNKCDQVIMYQDGNMRKRKFGEPANEWMFTRYDAMGRVIMTGITTEFPTQSRADVQLEANKTGYKCREFILPAGTVPASENNYYSGQSFPPSAGNNCKILMLNYYDSYKVWMDGNSEPTPIVNDANLAFSLPPDSYPLYQPSLDFIAGKPAVSFVYYIPVMLASAMYYDMFGRVIQTNSQNHARGYDCYTNQYQGLTSGILKTEHRHLASFVGKTFSLSERSDYTYDAAGRPATFAYTYNGGGPRRIVNYAYHTLGQVKSKQISDDTYRMQTIDYAYNIRGWLTGINDPGDVSDAGDLFGMELLYNTQNTDLMNIPAYNGNISGVAWQTAQPDGTLSPATTGKKAYTFAYDKLNRLLSGKYAEATGGAWEFNDRYSELTDNGSAAAGYRPYDLNGNILTMKRYGLRAPNNNPNTIDELTYTYDGNRLIAVDDAVMNDNGGDFVDNGQYYNGTDPEYAYDKNGNLTRDSNKGILSIRYNYLNLPVSIARTGNMRLEYQYDAAGVKRQQKYYATVEGNVVKTTDFIGNFVYENNLPAWVVYDEGRVVLKSDGSAYCNEAWIKDHLGNVRVTFHQESGVLKTRQVDSYYPFGMNIKNLSANSNDADHPNEYLYNGKMFQDEMGLNWLDYGARFYDAVVGRFHSGDRYSEKYMNVTQYHYALNNPIKLIDINGDSTKVFILDKSHRPQDNGISGTSYTATIYLVDENGAINGPFKGSSYPNSKSNSDNTAASNTLNEGTHQYNNESGHKGGTQKGLNIDDSGTGARTTRGTTPEGNDTQMQYVNVHAGFSDNGNASSRGSLGCQTIAPVDAEEFYSNFNWSGPSGNTGNTVGTIMVVRSDEISNTMSTTLETRKIQQQLNLIAPLKPLTPRGIVSFSN